MKILMTVFQMMDYGGIVQYTENLAKGFIKQGHSVQVVMLRNSERDPYVRQENTVVEGNYKSTIANRAHAANGWYGISVYSYGNKRQRKLWRKCAEKFDLVIHQIPCPEADVKGAWRKLYNIEVPQVLVSHDAHFPDRYPHLIDIADKIVGIAAVNPASFASLAGFPAPRCLIGSPHIPLKWDEQDRWKKRPRRFVSAHVWKPWKHMDLVVRAIPYTKKLGIENWIGGDGIEARYMRSIEKCKPQYKGIWKRAEKAGMSYEGMTSPKKLLSEYADARVMVDMSFSKKFVGYGNHVNRSTLEAYNAGCIPLVTKENMKELWKPRLFRNFFTHVEVPAETSPKKLAEAIADAINMSSESAETIVENGRELLLKYWDYRVVAKHFMELASLKKKAGIYRNLVDGELTSEIQTRRDKYMNRIENRRSN